MSIKEKLNRTEIEALKEALTLTEGNVTEASDLLGKSREWVRRHCLEHGIKPDAFRFTPVEWRVTFRGTSRNIKAKTENEALAKAVRALKVAKSEVAELVIEKS